MKVSQAVKSRLTNGPILRGRGLEILDHNLYEYCIEKAKELGYENLMAALYILLNPNSNECETCGNGTKFGSMNAGFVRFCSPKCRATSPDQIQMTRDRLHTPKIRSKIEKTSFERYGTPFAICSTKARSKSKKTCLDRYGVENGGAAKEAKLKRNATMVKRYGVEHNMQCRELFDKQKLAGFKQREFKLSGKIFKVRGFEDIAVDYLHSQMKVAVNDIATTHAEGIPSIKWKDRRGEHYYHPDIYAKIKGRKWLIEVKSDYTAGFWTKSGLFSVLKKKIQACVDNGYRAKVFIINKKHQVAMIENLHEKTKAEVKREVAETILRLYG